jgi:ribonuclease HI
VNEEKGADRMFRDHTNGGIKQYASLLLYVDGGCEPKNPGGVATAGWAIFDPKNPTMPLAEEGRVAEDGGKIATNNLGEYSALCFALRWLTQQGWRGELTVKTDSKLLVEQVNGRWKVKAEHLAVLCTKVWTYMDSLDLFRVTESEPLPPEGKFACYILWIPRELNEHANELCRLAYKEHTTT